MAKIKEKSNLWSQVINCKSSSTKTENSPKKNKNNEGLCALKYDRLGFVNNYT